MKYVNNTSFVAHEVHVRRNIENIGVVTRGAQLTESRLMRSPSNGDNQTRPRRRKATNYVADATGCSVCLRETIPLLLWKRAFRCSYHPSS
jgi:hypothetical protein